MKMTPIVVSAENEEEAFRKFKEMLQDERQLRKLFHAYSRIEHGIEYFYDICSIETPVGRLETWADKEIGLVGIQLVPDPETGDAVNIAIAECNEYTHKDVMVKIYEDVRQDESTKTFMINGEEALDMVSYTFERADDF